MRAFAFAAVLLALAGCSSQGLPTVADNQLPPDAILVDPASAGWSAAALAEAVEYARSQGTTGFLVMDDGRIVAEYNWPATDAAFARRFVHGTSATGALLEDVASQQKSLVAVLVAIAADKRLIDVEQPVARYLGPGWSKAAPAEEAAITVRHLMEMRSGLKEDLTFEAPAGTTFFYNTPAYARLKPVLERASGMTLDAVTHDWLTGPAGMSDTSWRQRPAGFEGADNPTGLVTSPRDLAKLGQLVMANGVAEDGTRLVSSRWMSWLTQRSETNPAYGRLWWLNGSDYSRRSGGARREGQLIPAAPRDMVAALGAMGRKLYVVPSKKLIVVRMGRQPTDADEFDQRLWERLARAIPR